MGLSPQGPNIWEHSWRDIFSLQSNCSLRSPRISLPGRLGFHDRQHALLGILGNTMKLTPGHAFQLFYWDYVIGIVLGSLGWGFTLGNWGGRNLSFLSNIRQTDSRHVLFAIAGGAVFNVANLLLVAAIDIAGLAVAFPIGIGLPWLWVFFLNYAISPKGHPLLLFGGMALVVLAIILDALAYRRRETERRSISARGIWISVACGVLMGTFYPP